MPNFISTECELDFANNLSFNSEVAEQSAAGSEAMCNAKRLLPLP